MTPSPVTGRSPGHAAGAQRCRTARGRARLAVGGAGEHQEVRPDQLARGHPALLDRLERRGFVERRRDPHDRRKVVIVPVTAADGPIERIFEDLYRWVV